MCSCFPVNLGSCFPEQLVQRWPDHPACAVGLPGLQTPQVASAILYISPVGVL